MKEKHIKYQQQEKKLILNLLKRKLQQKKNQVNARIGKEYVKMIGAITNVEDVLENLGEGEGPDIEEGYDYGYGYQEGGVEIKKGSQF